MHHFSGICRGRGWESCRTAPARMCAQHPIGTGPFRFVSMTPDRGNRAGAESELFWRDAENRTRALSASAGRHRARAGTAQRQRRFGIAFNSLTPGHGRRAGEAIRASRLTQGPGTIAGLSGVQFRRSDSGEARSAPGAGLCHRPRSRSSKYLLRGQARLAASLLPPNHWAYEPNVRQYDYDPARARTTLDAAGLPRGKDGVRLPLDVKNFHRRIHAAL